MRGSRELEHSIRESLNCISFILVLLPAVDDMGEQDDLLRKLERYADEADEAAERLELLAA